MVSLDEFVSGAGGMTPREVRRTGHITAHRLRKSLDPYGHIIETVTGSGYRLRLEPSMP